MNDTAKTNYEIAAELNELYEQFKESIGKAEKLLRQCDDGSVYERARSYWLAEIRIALDNDHGYMARGGAAMRDTIEEIEALDGDEKDE